MVTAARKFSRRSEDDAAPVRLCLTAPSFSRGGYRLRPRDVLDVDRFAVAPPPRLTRDATLATTRPIARVAFFATRVARLTTDALPERLLEEVLDDFFEAGRTLEPIDLFAVDFLPEDDFAPVLRDAPALLFALVLRAVFFVERFAADFVARGLGVDSFAVPRVVGRVDDVASGFFATIDFEDGFFSDFLPDEPPSRAALFDEPLFFDVLRISS